jgi:hypothetical protein
MNDTVISSAQGPLGYVTTLQGLSVSLFTAAADRDRNKTAELAAGKHPMRNSIGGNI